MITTRPITKNEERGIFSTARMNKGMVLKADLDALYLSNAIDSETYHAARCTLAMTHGVGGRRA